MQWSITVTRPHFKSGTDSASEADSEESQEPPVIRLTLFQAAGLADRLRNPADPAQLRTARVLWSARRGTRRGQET